MALLGAKVHESGATLRGDARAAFDVARTALLALGFDIVRESDTELVARGPGLHSNREPALLGATELHFRIASEQLAARATLGGVARMKTFLYLFPVGLALLMAALGGGSSLRAIVIWLLPWLVLSPWMALALERKTTQAVDRLVAGMVGAGPARR